MLIELVSYATQKGTSEAGHIHATDAAHQAVIAPLSGFRERMLCSASEDGGFWTDMVFWRDNHSFEAAAQSVVKNPACEAWLGTIDQSSISLQTTALLPGYSARDFRLADAGCWLVVTWFTHDGVDAEEHIALNRDIQTQEMPKHDGFLAVATARQPDSGQYFEFVAWRDLDAARQGFKTITDACMQHPRFQLHFHQCDKRRVSHSFLTRKKRLLSPAAARAAR